MFKNNLDGQGTILLLLYYYYYPHANNNQGSWQRSDNSKILIDDFFLIKIWLWIKQ